MKRRAKRKYTPPLTEAKQQLIAKVLVRNEHTIKQVAADFGISYAKVHNILKTRVNVRKILTLRYPDEPES
jgi:hypothetical protein